MSEYPHPLIAKEGWPYIAPLAIVSLAVAFFAGWLSMPFWLLTLFVLQFFRDPPRQIPAGSGFVLSPADGRVVAVEKSADPYAKRDSLKISVFMNVFNVHSNRMPVDGRVEDVWYSRGKFINAQLAKASEENERNAVTIRTPEGMIVTCVQVAGLIARRILCYVSAGDMRKRGDRYGFIRFGSRVDVYLPVEAKARVSIGDKVYASESVLAELA
jgi:phosphatidylserine decarboxylase